MWAGSVDYLRLPSVLQASRATLHLEPWWWSRTARTRRARRGAVVLVAKARRTTCWSASAGLLDLAPEPCASLASSSAASAPPTRTRCATSRSTSHAALPARGSGPAHRVPAQAGPTDEELSMPRRFARLSFGTKAGSRSASLPWSASPRSTRALARENPRRRARFLLLRARPRELVRVREGEVSRHE